MSSAILVDQIGAWLVQQAMGEPEAIALFEGTCRRLHAAGLPVVRATANWTTLHPLFQVEAVIWERGEGAILDQFPYRPEGSGPTQAYLQSPFRAVIESGIGFLRRNLDGPEALLDFPILQEFAERGYTDYLLLAHDLSLPGAGMASMRKGILVSFCADRPGGFTDREIAALKEVTDRYALVAKIVIQSRIARTIGETYLGSRAGIEVLGGRVHRGDGETIPAIVFYSDLRRSTEIVDRDGREGLIAVLNSYFDCVAEPIIEAGGDVLSFIGDAVLAMFPIGEDGAGPAARRAFAALADARGRLAELNHARVADGEEPIASGTGIARGNVMFGNIGIASRLSYSVIGPTVNRVARIEQLTKEFGVPALTVGNVAKYAPDMWRPVGRRPIRGFAEPVDLFALEGDEGLRPTSADGGDLPELFLQT